MSKSYRKAPPEGRPLDREQYEPSITEGLEDMAEQTVTVYVVMNEWQPIGLDTDLSEAVYHSFTEDSAWDVLNGLAHDRGIDLPLNDTSFTVPNPDPHTEYETYYIDNAEVHQ